MPVFPIVENAVFRPPLLELMGDAFDTAMGLLSVVPSKIVQEAMANRIIQAAHEGERDIERLRQVALTGMSVPTNSEFGRPFSGAGGVLRDQVAPV